MGVSVSTRHKFGKDRLNKLCFKVISDEEIFLKETSDREVQGNEEGVRNEGRQQMVMCMIVEQLE